MRRTLALAVAGVAFLGIFAAAGQGRSAEPPLSGSPVLPRPTPMADAEPAGGVVAFYYGWFGNPTHDGKWIHWNDPRLGIRPPRDISSDYYPRLGAYSSRDPVVLRQHMRWLRQARVGVIALSWWSGETTDAYVKQVLDAAKVAGIKVTLHMEPAGGRTAANYQSDVIRLVKKFGRHPAFFTTTLGSPYVKAGRPKPLVFVWATAVMDLNDAKVVKPAYWAKANDAIRRQVGALVLACPCGGGYDVAVTEGRFDGAYNYATLHLQEEGGFDWARTLPPGALYVPSVMPGNHAERIGYPKETILPRRDGATYDEQWSAALGTGIVPDLVSITSFNEWHEGSQIEPARASYSAGGRTYLDFLPRSPTYYLDRTAYWTSRYLSGDYPQARSTQVRVRVTTTSDWVSLTIQDASLARPGPITASREATRAEFDGATLAMNQAVSRATAGEQVSMTFEALALGDGITVVGDSGFLGSTTFVVEHRVGGAWVELGQATWLGGIDAGQQRTIALP